MNQNTEVNEYLDMSDEEIMGMSAPRPVAADPEPEVTPEAEPAVTPEPEVVEPEITPEPEVVSPLAQADGEEVKPVVAEPEKVEAEAAEPVVAEKVEAEVKPAEAAPAPSAEDYKSFYDRLLGAPIRANGKEIQLKSIDEVEQLAKMGLNYTKKMQAMQPHLRVVKMLENNKLTEADLPYLIDLHQRKPDAIQKLLNDSQFDPHTVDAEKAESYVPGNHQVTDLEIQFDTALGEVETTPTGPELIREVVQWDAASKQALFQEPKLLGVINEQKASGLYAQIASEIDRRRALGDLQGVPFLAAYEQVGKQMFPAQPAASAPAQVETPKPVPVETRVVVPAPQVSNNEKAKAASPTKQTPSTVQAEVAYLDMTDEEFEKHMKTWKGRT